MSMKDLTNWKLIIIFIILGAGLTYITILPNFIIRILGYDIIGLIWFAYFLVLLYKLMD